MDVEERVLALVAAGDACAAATAAIEGYGPGVFRHLSSLLDGDDAHDAYAVWAEDVWRGLAGFRREFERLKDRLKDLAREEGLLDA